MTTIIDGSANADFATPLPLTEGGTGIATATTAIVQIKNVQTGLSIYSLGQDDKGYHQTRR